MAVLYLKILKYSLVKTKEVCSFLNIFCPKTIMYAGET